MREILFRGKRKDCNEWEIGDYSKYHHSYGIISHYINGFEYEVYPETVGQYTGINDKNGNRVFEGDIVALDERVKMLFNINDGVGVVDYRGGEFYVKTFFVKSTTIDTLNALITYDDILRGEVIGNIYDNPELLTT